VQFARDRAIYGSNVEVAPCGCFSTMQLQNGQYMRVTTNPCSWHEARAWELQGGRTTHGATTATATQLQLKDPKGNLI